MQESNVKERQNYVNFLFSSVSIVNSIYACTYIYVHLQIFPEKNFGFFPYRTCMKVRNVSNKDIVKSFTLELSILLCRIECKSPYF